jgi:hypothetical protein
MVLGAIARAAAKGIAAIAVLVARAGYAGPVLPQPEPELDTFHVPRAEAPERVAETDEANDAIQPGDYDRALLLLEQAVKKHPSLGAGRPPDPASVVWGPTGRVFGPVVWTPLERSYDPTPSGHLDDDLAKAKAAAERLMRIRTTWPYPAQFSPVPAGVGVPSVMRPNRNPLTGW